MQRKLDPSFILRVPSIETIYVCIDEAISTTHQYWLGQAKDLSVFDFCYCTLHLRLTLGNASSRVLAIEQNGNLLQSRTLCLHEEEVDHETLDDQAVKLC